MTSLHVSILGTPRLTVDHQRVALRGRLLLIVLRLALAGNVPVSPRRLHDDVWGPDHDGDGALRVSLTRLRRSIGPGLVERHDDGYLLRSATTDSDRFELLLRHARDRSSSIEQRIAVYDEALGMWTGPAFEGLERLAWLDSEATRLDELRDQAIDERFELRLLVHDPALVVPELRNAVESAPRRERRAELLALALYRTDRQSDALAAIQRVATVLRDESGLEPGPGLRLLEHRILVHDPALLETPLTIRSLVAADTESRLRAANTLVRVGAHSEAIAILDQAELEAGAAGDRASVAACLLARAVANAMSGTGDADPLIDRARDIARELRDGPLLARCALTRFGSGAPTDVTAGLVELIEPIELLPASAPARVDLLCAAAVMVILVNNSDTPDRLLSAAMEVDESQRSTRSAATLAATRSMVGATRGDDPGDVEADAVRSFELALTTDDPTVLVVACHALMRSRYARGDLDGVDEILGPLLGAARSAMMPFAIVRVGLCRTTNAIARGEIDHAVALIDETTSLGERLRTVNTAAAVLGQRFLALYEQDRLASVIPELRHLTDRGNAQWHMFEAIHRLADPGGSSLLELVDDISHDVFLLPFAALAAEVALRSDDAELGVWCATHLDEAGDSAVVVGLGTILLGVAPHFAGVARAASGDVDGAIDRLTHAHALATARGAHLWSGHSAALLARLLFERDQSGDGERARQLIADVTASPAIEQSARLALAVEDAAGARSDSRTRPVA